MMKFIALLLKVFFRFGFFKKYFFAIHTRIFKPLKLFKGQTAICDYGDALKIKVNLDEWIQQQIYFFGGWDQPGSNFLRKTLRENDVFIDIGANIGPYSLLASELVGRTGKVYAFEPVSEVFERLVGNIELNNLQNIIAVRKAVYKHPCMLDINVSNRDNMGMSGIHHHDNESGVIESAEAVTLDDFVDQEGLNKVSLIKIDIEGAELYALEGMKKVLKRFSPLILIEMSNDVLSNAPYSGIEISHFLKKLGYNPSSIDNDGNLTAPQPENGYHNYVFSPSGNKDRKDDE